MPYQIIRNDITKMNVDVIVNSANPKPLIGGGVDFAIHEAGGKELVQARIDLGDITTSEVKYTKGYKLPSKYVFHTVGPVYKDGHSKERIELYDCYKNSLELALKLNCKSIAFPLISAGVFGYPKNQALRVATRAAKDFLNNHDISIYLVLFKHDS